MASAALTKVQSSNDNPGWTGRGVPGLRDLVRGRTTAIVRLLRERKALRAWYLSKGSAADFYHFYVSSQRAAVECPCCGYRGPAFLAAWNWRATAYQSRCPSCDSRSRHRGLALALPGLLRRKPAGKILVFAPERIVLDALQRQPIPCEVATTDLFSKDVDFPGEDIQRLSFSDGSFAMLMCNHVLEHVPDDFNAMKECARILAPGGIAVFTIPGDYGRERTWTFPAPDSNGHFRHYGMDVVDRLRETFAHVEVCDLSLGSPRHAAIRKSELAFVCWK